MNTQNRIPDTDEAWEGGELGREEAFIGLAPDDAEDLINAALELQPISIRLEKSLIEDFKMIAAFYGMGYQPLMRQALKRFADCESKRLLQEVLLERQREQAAKASTTKTSSSGVKSRKAA